MYFFRHIHLSNSYSLIEWIGQGGRRNDDRRRSFMGIYCNRINIFKRIYGISCHASRTETG